MTSVFLHFLNLSITAGWMVLAVLLLRLCLKKSPRWITCMLWGLVALRLVLPFSIESPVSLIPTAKTVVSTDSSDVKAPVVNSGMSAIDKPLNDWLQTPVAPPVQSPLPPISNTDTNSTPDLPVGDTDSVPQKPDANKPSASQEASVTSRAERMLQIAAPVWLVGIGLMLFYELFSVLRVRSRVLDAVRLRDNVWQSDRVASPFIFGLLCPRIYVPYGLEEPVLEQVLSHEYAHLHRRDHWIKPFAFTLLAVYWYNPLLWVGYILLCRDIEVACDQRVIRTLDEDSRRRYATALLQCGVERRSIAACPLAFGEVSIKQRIKLALNYRKPLLWVIIASLVVCAVAAVCLLTVPKSEDDKKEESLVVLNSQEIKPDQERKFYSTDTDGALVSAGFDWLWEHAENPDAKTPDIDMMDETNIPLVVSHSKTDLDQLMDACSDDEWDQVDMRDWFELEKYDDAYFEDKVIVWLFVPGYDLATYDYTVTLEETNKGLRYAVTLEYVETSMFDPWPGRCEYLLLFETDRKLIEEAESLSTRHERAPITVPTEEGNWASLSVGNVDLDGDGEEESMRIFHSPMALEGAFMVVCKADGTAILRETINHNYHSQCYLVPQDDGSSMLLFVEADERGTYYACESFGVLSLKDGVRTVLDNRSDGRVHDYLDLGDLITYYESLSGWMENAQLLYECENGSLYYGDELGDTPRYTPLCWLDEYREGDDEAVLDIVENIIDSVNGEIVPLGEIDFDEDGKLDSFSALRYSLDSGFFYTHLLVKNADGDIIAGHNIHLHYGTIDRTVYLYRVTDDEGKERLQKVQMAEGSNNNCSVYNLTMEGSEWYLDISRSDAYDYVDKPGVELICYMQGMELYFPDEAPSNNYLNEDATKYTVENYNPSIVAYNAFLKGQRVAHEYGDLETKLYVSDLYDIMLEKGISRYALADVTGDGVPELLTDGYTMSVFTYQSGRLLRLYESRAGAFATLLSNGCLWEWRSGTGEFYWYTKFFEIGTTRTIYFDIGYHNDGNDYSVDGVQMTKSEYESLTSDYIAASKSPALLLWYNYADKQPASQAMAQYLSLLNNAYYGADVYYALYDADFDGQSELLIKKQDNVIIGLPWANPTITNVAESITWVSMVEKPLHLLDVTADGYSDVLVEYNESARGKQYAFLRWDTEKERLVMIPTIIYNPSFDSETAVIRSETHGDEIVSYGMYRYDAQTENLICTHSLYFEENEQATGDSDRMKLVVTENGVTKTLYVRGEPYGLDKTDPQVAPYYAPDSFWNLDSLQWENYVAQYVSDYVHILQRNHSEADAEYAIHDMDGDGWRELLVLEGTKLTVYARTEQAGMIRVLVEQDFLTATSRFLLTGDDQYPGLVYVCIGGGKEWYYYLSLDQVQNDAFVLMPLWTDNYAEFGIDEDGRITELSDDAQLIAVSRYATSVPFVSYDL